MFYSILFLFFAVASAASIGNLVARVDNCARTYTVRLGDTCDAISVAQNVSTYQLATVNTNIDAGCDNLALGEPLCLGITGQDCTETYVVQSGNDCGTIADGAGIDRATLLANNPNVNEQCTNIYPSEVLCVADHEVYSA